MRTSTALAIVTLIATAACGGGSEPSPPTPQAAPAVVNSDMGIRLGALPDGWEVVSSDGMVIELTRPDDPGTPQLGIELEPGDHVVNLVEEVQAEPARFADLPEGRHFGSRELQTHLGPAYSSRGSYRGEDGRIEEAVIFVTHPVSDRLLTLTYRYPEGDETAARVTEMIEVASEIEPDGGAATR